MNWAQHLVFNIVFVLLALLGILLIRSERSATALTKNKNIWLLLLSLFGISVFLVFFLFLTSETLIHHRNPFVRLFIPHFINKKYQMDLTYNSYYIAGTGRGKIYLGNYTDPSKITVLNETLETKKQYTMELDHRNVPFRSIQVKVVPPYFYVLDGTVSCIYAGNIADWKAVLKKNKIIRFSAAAIINDSVMAVRTRETKNAENTLGIIEFGKRYKVQLSPSLLQKQIDGVFDTDGSLHYNRQLQKLIYVYYYRNQFIVAGQKNKLLYRGNTIDTNTIAKLKIAYLPKQGLKQFSAPPLTVNASSAVFKNLLFVHSNLEGRFDSAKMRTQASVIDIYDIVSNTYKFSFYVYSINHQKMKSFTVTDSYLYALIDNKIVAYSLGNLFEKDMRKPN